MIIYLILITPSTLLPGVAARVRNNRTTFCIEEFYKESKKKKTSPKGYNFERRLKEIFMEDTLSI